ncbi:MAG: tetratricopeptide repeat protein [Candidatus Hodarchaeales archaeon]|jgi:tetratricopeptide (TPR) repeat protein
MITYSTELLNLLPELDHLLTTSDSSVISFFNDVFEGYNDVTQKETSKKLLFGEYLIKFILLNSHNIHHEDVFYIGCFLALWKGKVDNYFKIRSFIDKENKKYYSILSIECFYHIILSGNIDLVNSHLESIKIYLEKHGIGDSKENSKILINYFGIKSYLFELRGNFDKSNQFFSFALREVSNQNFGSDVLIITYFLRIVNLIKTDIARAEQLTLDLIDIIKEKNNRYFLAIATIFMGKILYYQDDPLSAFKIYSRVKKSIKDIQAEPLQLLLLIDIGELEKVAGRLVKSLGINKKVISTATIISLPKMLTLGLRHSADIYLLQLNFQVAQDLYEKAIIITKKTHDYNNRAYCLQQLGSLLLTQKNYVEAHKAFLLALELIETYNIEKLNLNFELGQLFYYLENINNVKMIHQLMRTSIHKIGKHSQLILFDAQKNLLEKNYEEARLILEELYLKKEKLSYIALLNVILLLFQLDLINYNLEKDEIILEDAESRLEEIFELGSKPGYSGINILIIILKSLWIYLYKKKRNPISSPLLTNAWELAEKNNHYYLIYLAKKYERRLKRASRRINHDDLDDTLFHTQRLITIYQNVFQKQY